MSKLIETANERFRLTKLFYEAYYDEVSQLILNRLPCYFNHLPELTDCSIEKLRPRIKKLIGCGVIELTDSGSLKLKREKNYLLIQKSLEWKD